MATEYEYTAHKHTRVLPGTVAGLLAYAVGFLLTYALTAGRVAQTGAGEAAAAIPGTEPTWTLVGWAFYSEHFVPIYAALPGESLRTVPLVGASLPTYLFLVPPVLLLAAGVAVARRGDVTDLDGAVKHGLSVWPGYFAPVVVFVFLTRAESRGLFVGPDPVLSVVVAGVVYPFAFGVAGATLALFAETGRVRG